MKQLILQLEIIPFANNLFIAKLVLFCGRVVRSKLSVMQSSCDIFLQIIKLKFPCYL